MKIVKYLLFTVLGIVAAILVAALFISRTYHLERFVTIHAPQALIMDQISNLKKANEWSPFMAQDKEVQVTYSQVDGQVGSWSHWESKKSGVGTQTIVKLTADRVETRLDFEKPMKSTDTAFFQSQPEGTDVKVTWGMEGSHPYPLNFMNLLVDGYLGKIFDKGLNNLKNRCESMKPEATPAVVDTNTGS